MMTASISAGGQEVAVSVGVAGIDLWHRFAGFLYDVVGALEHDLIYVADRDNIDVRAPEGEGEVAFATEAGADDGEADAIDGLCGFRARC